MKLIYIAGPYRAPDRETIARNIAAAREEAIFAGSMGWFPVCPHLNTAHMEDDLPHLGDEFWLAGTMRLMERCHAVLLVPGWEQSAGTLAEICRARACSLPVFQTRQQLLTAGEFARLGGWPLADLLRQGASTNAISF